MAALVERFFKLQYGKPPYQLGSFWIQVTEDLTNCSLLMSILIVYLKKKKKSGDWWSKGWFSNSVLSSGHQAVYLLIPLSWTSWLLSSSLLSHGYRMAAIALSSRTCKEREKGANSFFSLCCSIIMKKIFPLKLPQISHHISQRDRSG